MANAYVDPNFDLDTSCNVADLTTLKGSAPDAEDKIYVYNGATLTVESALACLLISLGETSAGAATDGQRRGNLTINAGVTITFTGNATANASGIKSSPASAPGTAGESKLNTLTINGTAANPVVFTNSVGGFNASFRYSVYWFYGPIAAWDNLVVKYPSMNGTLPFLYVGLAAAYTSESSRTLGTWTVNVGDLGATELIIMPRYTATLPLNYGRLTIDASEIVTTDGRSILPFVHNTNPTHSIEGSLYVVPSATKYYYLRWTGDQRPGAAVPFYANHARASVTVDIRPTLTVPAGLALADPSPTADGELVVSWTNAASYAAGDKLVVYNASGDAVLGILDATAGSGRISGLTNGTGYTVYAKATSDNYIFSAASANAGPTTCTGTDAPTAANTRTTDTTRDVPGTSTVPAAGDLDAGVQCGAAGTEVTGTRVDAAAGNVLAGSGNIGDPAAPIVPTLTLPAAGAVAVGTGLYGNPGSQVTPTRVDAAAGNVLAGSGNIGDPAAPIVPTLTVPAAGKVMADAGNYGNPGSPATPTLAVTKVRDTASGGTLDSNKVLKSYAAEAGNWDDDNLGVGSEGNVKKAVAYGLSQAGSLTEGAEFSTILDNPVYAVGATATVTGGVTLPVTATGVTVTLTRKKKADGSTVATPVSASVDFTASVQKTWAQIAGAAVTFAPATAQEEYLEAAVSGGTPGVTSETSGQVPYAVVPAFTAPALAVADDGDGSVTPTASANAGQTSRLKYRHSADAAWTVGANAVGDGAFTGPTGLLKGAGAGYYQFQLVPYDSVTGLEGPPGNVVILHLADSSAAADTSELDDEQASACDEILEESGRTVTYNPYGGTPVEATAIVALTVTQSIEAEGRQVLIHSGTVRLKATVATAPDRRDTFAYNGETYACEAPPRHPAGGWVVFPVRQTVRVMQASGATRR